MAIQNTSVDKNSRAYLQQQFKGGRVDLLLLLALSVVNLVMLALDSGNMMLFSASVPYYLVWFGKCMDNGTLNGSGAIGSITGTALVIAAVILVVYFLCWLLSKKRSGWLVFATVLFALDTAVLALIALFLMESPSAFIMDLLIHAYLLYLLIRGCIAANMLRNMAPEAPEGCLGSTPELDP